MKINVCKNNHHYIDDVKCPQCGESTVKKLEARKGDCIVCRQLCPSHAYGCSIPNENNNRDKEIFIFQ